MEAIINDSVENLDIALNSVNITFDNVESYNRSQYIAQMLFNFPKLIEVSLSGMQNMVDLPFCNVSISNSFIIIKL